MVLLHADSTSANITAELGRILRQEQGVTTLYVGGAQISLKNGQLQASRYYTFAGSTWALRSADTLTWLLPDHQGTTHHQINSSTGVVTTLWQDPYGKTRSTTTSWEGERSFVGGMKDATGLIRIGARDYDPVLDRFITVDPLQDLADPLQWNAYLYANNSPVTKADPSGLGPVGDENGTFIPSTKNGKISYTYTPNKPKVSQVAKTPSKPTYPGGAPKPIRPKPTPMGIQPNEVDWGLVANIGLGVLGAVAVLFVLELLA